MPARKFLLAGIFKFHLPRYRWLHCLMELKHGMHVPYMNLYKVYDLFVDLTSKMSITTEQSLYIGPYDKMSETTNLVYPTINI